MIIAVLVSSMRTVVRRLMDGVEAATLDLIEHEAATVPGVASVGQARARWSGHRLEADLDVAVEGTLSVQTGHDLAHTVAERLLCQVPHLQQATVHVIPARADRRIPGS